MNDMGGHDVRIWEKFQLGNVTFQSRIVMAPMVPFGITQEENGALSEAGIRHYTVRAQEGLGLMISQALAVSDKAAMNGGAGAFSDAHIPGLRAVADACHEKDIRFFAQLSYPGPGYGNGGSIMDFSEDDLRVIGADFVRAARRCADAGCDGVELHGAHSYFLNMLASSVANRRTDAYGGDLDGRLRLVAEIVEGIRGFAGPDFIVSYRMGWTRDLEGDAETARALVARGIDLLHVSSGIPSDRPAFRPAEFPYGEITYAGARVKKNVDVPVTVVGGIATLNRGNALVEDGLCDFVAYGKPFLADGAFVTHSRADGDAKPCLTCRPCKWFENGSLCPARRKRK